VHRKNIDKHFDPLHLPIILFHIKTHNEVNINFYVTFKVNENHNEREENIRLTKLLKTMTKNFALKIMIYMIK
jgi:hypothetical protein